MLSLIENHSVVIVHGSTGSGKSTQLPQYVLDHCAQHSIYCNIVVTQPRRIGASSIARWISKQRSWPLGELVGYQVKQCVTPHHMISLQWKSHPGFASPLLLKFIPCAVRDSSFNFFHSFWMY